MTHRHSLPVVALEVVEDCFFVADGSVVSNARPLALAEWELGYPREVRHTARCERAPKHITDRAAPLEE